jgi:hypothetical protein
MVIVRNVPQNKKIIDEYGYKIIGPYNAPQYIPAKESKEAAQEIKRAVETAPDSSVIASYALEFLNTH